MTTPTDALETLRYPIGRNDAIAPRPRAEQIRTLREFPAHLRSITHDLSDAQLDTPYREGGWTVRQLVHHVADSHMNCYIRTKLALTETNPTITAYDQGAWANLVDSRLPIETSLQILEGIHTRLVTLLDSLTDADYEKTFQHPERGATTLAGNLALYDWHSRHHAAHITGLRQRMGW